ncbi:MAG: N-acetylmuramoyl-L-alanine amidase [Lachnospiraceae bacterium]|nr:N-acetylmuramoyl-L-alanine amidase [Lachnospiraceae bacterium]
MARIVIDPGHGGSDSGAVYEGRREKDDNLRLALRVGEILENNGADIVYTRTTDVYNTPFEKAMMGNNADADYFISFHRNALPTPNTGTGIETLVFSNQGEAANIASSINAELAELGFTDRGVIERPNLVVLRRTRMPAVLVEAGFIDNEADNAKFDAEFEQIAQAIADGILNSVNVASTSAMVYDLPFPPGRPCMPLFRIQVAAYINYNNAAATLDNLLAQNLPAFIIREDELYKVQVGAYEILDNAIRMERRLREAGYNTFIVSGCQGRL